MDRIEDCALKVSAGLSAVLLVAYVVVTSGCYALAPAGAACIAETDCESGICTNSKCMLPACNDKVKNGTETDIDCGGNCAPCADGKACGNNADCACGVCTGGKCTVPGTTTVLDGSVTPVGDLCTAPVGDLVVGTPDLATANTLDRDGDGYAAGADCDDDPSDCVNPLVVCSDTNGKFAIITYSVGCASRPACPTGSVFVRNSDGSAFNSPAAGDGVDAIPFDNNCDGKVDDGAARTDGCIWGDILVVSPKTQKVTGCKFF